jgi:predicted dienelactone hydrolase
MIGSTTELSRWSPLSLIAHAGLGMHWLFRSAALLACMAGTCRPALALDEVVVELPLLENTLKVKLSELKTPEALMQGSSDLAELDRASNGELGRKLLKLLNQPVPVSFRQLVDSSTGSPLLEQVLLLVSSFGTVEGQSPDLSGETLKQALEQATAQSPDGEPTLLQLMEAIPGERVRLNLSQAQVVLARMLRHRRRAERLMASALPAPAATDGVAASPVAVQRTKLPVRHRSEPLELVVMRPADGGSGRLVVISHGLWDSPRNFEGWGQRLAAQGYSVVLPRHPGSDKHQQHEVLSGQAPPPSPEELALRAQDITAINDAAAQGQLSALAGVSADRVVVIGHSWGATTALQLAGLKPEDQALRARCANVNDPERNLSWTLQCSWLSAVSQAAVDDPRVIAVAAVSPPVSLLFPKGAAQHITGRVLLVSGTHDWVVPPDPEAVEPFSDSNPRGNQLVLVQGGDHFNLRPGQSADGGPLAPLLVEWTDRSFAAGPAVKPAPGAPPLLPQGSWGSRGKPMADVSNLVQGR